ncbi:hypothetical protein BPAE_0008g00310 [Botrytis paeoniae]|uniref:Uncharacterized protein n=1 Tax=Botrytis paeoniae TaxID=278948 RepID=A0A4Z1G4M7_9HELO|nr:hypothetical protein BPAE_0008g00310 [Botrytis paeoniae]
MSGYQGILRYSTASKSHPSGLGILCPAPYPNIASPFSKHANFDLHLGIAVASRSDPYRCIAKESSHTRKTGPDLAMSSNLDMVGRPRRKLLSCEGNFGAANIDFYLGELKNPDFEAEGDVVKVAYQILAVKAKRDSNRNSRQKLEFQIALVKRRDGSIGSLWVHVTFIDLAGRPPSPLPVLAMQHTRHDTVMCHHTIASLAFIQPCV